MLLGSGGQEGRHFREAGRGARTPNRIDAAKLYVGQFGCREVRQIVAVKRDPVAQIHNTDGCEWEE